MSYGGEAQTVPPQLMSGCGTFSWNVQTDIFQVDAALARLLDLTCEEQAHGITIKRYLMNVHPADMERVQERVNHSMTTGEPCRQAYRLVSEARGTVPIIAMGQCFRDTAGLPAEYAGMILEAEKFDAYQEEQGMIDHCLAAMESAKNLKEDVVAYLLAMALIEMGYKVPDQS